MAEHPPARCLDLTRLVSRQGCGALTGIDRVELAYLRHLLDDPLPLYLLVRTALGFLLLDQDGARRALTRLTGAVRWGRNDLVGLLSRKATPKKRRAEADLRRWAIGRCRRGRLAAMLRRHVQDGCAYLNVGHSNLGTEVLTAWGGHPGARISVFVHDLIPLLHPEFQRPETVAGFHARMRRVAKTADLVICNSRATRDDVVHQFAAWGRFIDPVVAHLGSDLPQVNAADLPPDLVFDAPAFLTLGTIEPRKNHALLLDIWEDFATEMPPKAVPHLVIAGARGWRNEALFHRLDTSPLVGRFVHERADLSDAAVAALMARADGLLFPSHAEGYGLPAVEAAALGVPLICSDLPVFREILHKIPVYAESGDVYLWKQSILHLAETTKARQRHGGPKPGGFDIPTWADHFNLVLKVT